MDISKAGGAPALSNPAAEGPKAGPDRAGGADKKFADLLAQAHANPAHQQPNAAHFSAPILDPQVKLDVNMGARVSGVGHRAGVEPARRGGPEMVGEKAGLAPAGHNPVEPTQGTKMSPVSLQRLANDSMKAESRMDAMIAAAQNGKSFSASELIALQVEVFRYSQTVEVISRSADKLVGAIKQTLGTQV